jgi:hypothetical protein
MDRYEKQALIVLVSLCITALLTIIILSSLLTPFREGGEEREDRERGWHGHTLTEEEKERNRNYLDTIREVK